MKNKDRKKAEARRSVFQAYLAANLLHEAFLNINVHPGGVLKCRF